MDMRILSCHGTAFDRVCLLFAALCATAPHLQAGPIVAACPAATAPRRALPGDTVCVPAESRARVAAENARAPLLWIPGPFGPKTCANGYVWREATPDDYVCVTPGIRTLVRGEQANPQLAPGQ